MIKLLCLMLVLLFSTPLFALSYVKVNIANVSNESLKAEGLALTINDFDQAQGRITLEAKHLLGKAHAEQPIDDFSFECPVLELSEKKIVCDKGQFQLNSKLITAEAANLAFFYLPDSQKIHLELSGLNLLSGKASVDIDYQQDRLAANVRLQKVLLSSASLSTFLPDSENVFEGVLSGNVSLEKQSGSITSQLDMSVAGMSFSNAEGDFLADAVNSEIKGRYQYSKQSHFLDQLSVSLDQGELLTPWFYTDLKLRNAQLSLRKANFNANKHWQINQFKFNDDALDITLSDVKGSEFAAEQFELLLRPVDLEQVYRFYFLPVLSHDLAQLNVTGKLEASLDMHSGEISDYQLNLSDVWLAHEPESGSSKFYFENLKARLHANGGSQLESYLQFNNAIFLDTIEFGEARIPLRTSPHSVAVSETTRLPVFDGAIIVETFSLNIAEESPEVIFKGILSPISLSEITRAIDWPEMSGKVSGFIPAVTYSDGNVSVDTTLAVPLKIEAFDGRILLRDVKVSHLLSSWPEFRTTIEMENIDLEKLTETFAFGKITGRVDGHVKKLLMENWEPTQFDAMLKTSEKSGRKRISQRAVDNITNLGGGGMAGALSRSFMRFFEDFGYDKLGFTCILRDGVCLMTGVENVNEGYVVIKEKGDLQNGLLHGGIVLKEGKCHILDVEEVNQGYHLVKGGGIPRIDIKGSQRCTNWNVLLDRLANIADSGSPTIE